ncbi:HpcH/HpaI aldolase/citrate lyase family protein [Hephaestia sp. GCM10023244]|uniref:HpcH/HpaI aldolase family protein n=1 Tax=unclassified Hephaestia TaxID=2631281 RepID=UPI00207735F6|nr:aldolase/citrate lyase family protein [Hephaestia sp. MAHUQ-44]MCM8732282.1 aldolase/citrate lyase family protein [Hephaestia sp. MAHUQ-44]
MFNASVKHKLEAGEVVFGSFFKLDSPPVAELFGLAGFDFLIIDAEHGTYTHAGIENIIRTCELMGMSSVVRTPDASEAHILHVLDSGASGIQVPSLKTADEVRDAIRKAKYWPLGERGSARACRAAAYGQSGADYEARANRDTLVSVHVENKEMVEQIDELCAIDELDVLFIGPGDLSQSLGHPGNAAHPDVVAAIDRVIEVAAGRKHIGTVVANAQQLDAYVARGVKYIAWLSDLGMLRGALGAAAKNFAPYRATTGETR